MQAFGRLREHWMTKSMASPSRALRRCCVSRSDLWYNKRRKFYCVRLCGCAARALHVLLNWRLRKNVLASKLFASWQNNLTALTKALQRKPFDAWENMEWLRAKTYALFLWYNKTTWKILFILNTIIRQIHVSCLNLIQLSFFVCFFIFVFLI